MNVTDIKEDLHLQLGDSALAENVYVIQADMLGFLRSVLADTVATYRWSDATLLGYIVDGIKEVIAYRTDCASATVSIEGTTITTTLPRRFSDAVVHYAAHKAYSAESEDVNDMNRRNYHLQQYNDAVDSLPYRWNDSVLEEYITDCTNEITRFRPDVKLYTYATTTGTIHLPDDLEDALIHFVMAKCYAMRFDSKEIQQKMAYYQNLYETEAYGSVKR